MNIKGIAASNGIAIAKAFKLIEPELTVVKATISDVEAEINLYKEALVKTTEELQKIKVKAAQNLSEEEAAVFDAHINMANDNEYFRERAADIKDIKKRILAHLLGVKVNDPSTIDEQVVIIAEDLTPSDTAQLDRNFVKGFATNIGGRTSHSAIMARSLEIPAVVGTKTILEDVKDGDMIILDGLEGNVIVNPTAEQVAHYEEVAKQYEAQKAEWAKLKNEKTVA